MSATKVSSLNTSPWALLFWATLVSHVGLWDQSERLRVARNLKWDKAETHIPFWAELAHSSHMGEPRVPSLGILMRRSPRRRTR